jgi:hypothetical protein
MYEPYAHFLIAFAGVSALTGFVWAFIEGVIRERGTR